MRVKTALFQAISGQPIYLYTLRWDRALKRGLCAILKILYNCGYSTPGDDNITDQKDIQNRRGEGVYRIPVQLADKFEESFHILFAYILTY